MWPNPRETADLVTFTEEILNEKLYFLFSGMCFWRGYKRPRILMLNFSFVSIYISANFHVCFALSK